MMALQYEFVASNIWILFGGIFTGNAKNKAGAVLLMSNVYLNLCANLVSAAMPTLTIFCVGLKFGFLCGADHGILRK